MPKPRRRKGAQSPETAQEAERGYYEPAAEKPKKRGRGRPPSPDSVSEAREERSGSGVNFNFAKCPICKVILVPRMTARGPAVPCRCTHSAEFFVSPTRTTTPSDVRRRILEDEVEL